MKLSVIIPVYNEGGTIGISCYGRTYREGKKINWKDGVRALWCLLKYSIAEPRAATYAEAALSLETTAGKAPPQE